MKKLELTQGRTTAIAVADWVCAVFLALLPILQHYRGLLGFVASAFLADILPVHYVNLADNMAITLMIIMAPYLAVRIVTRFRKENMRGFLLVTPLLAFYVFKVIDHGTSVAELLQVALSIGYLVALGLGCIDLKKFIKAATVIGCVIGAVMILQYGCYYVFDFHLQVVPDKLLLPSAEQWVKLVQTGRYSVNGNRILFYRPSAIFLEPSHLAIYCFPLLFINLYKSGKTVFNWIAGALVSIAIVLSTSGMGVAIVFCAWVLFATLWDAKTDMLILSSLKKWRQWLRGICTGLVLLILFLNIPSINSSIARIIGQKNISISMFLPSQGSGLVETSQPSIENTTQETQKEETQKEETQKEETQKEETEKEETQKEETKKPIINNKNAVSGRIKGALKILKEMTVGQWIVGCADSIAGSDTHMPGFMSIAYKYGVVGLILSYFFFAYGLTRFDADYFWATFVWFVVSFFSTHTHGMIYIVYYIMLFFNGHLETKGAWTGELKTFFGGFLPKRLRQRIETRDEE